MSDKKRIELLFTQALEQFGSSSPIGVLESADNEILEIKTNGKRALLDHETQGDLLRGDADRLHSIVSSLRS